MVHSNAIWNAILELSSTSETSLKPLFLHYLERFVTREHFKNKVSKECILTLFGTSEIKKKTSLKNALWYYFTRFGTTSETILKTRSLKHAFWQYLKRFGNKVNTLKTRSLKLAFDTIFYDITILRLTIFESAIRIIIHVCTKSRGTVRTRVFLFFISSIWMKSI